jgi:hypothetical protein
MAALVSSIVRHAQPTAAAAEVMIVNVAQLLYALLSCKRVLLINRCALSDVFWGSVQ